MTKGQEPLTKGVGTGSKRYGKWEDQSPPPQVATLLSPQLLRFCPLSPSSYPFVPPVLTFCPPPSSYPFDPQFLHFCPPPKFLSFCPTPVLTLLSPSQFLLFCALSRKSFQCGLQIPMFLHVTHPLLETAVFHYFLANIGCISCDFVQCIFKEKKDSD